MTNGRVVYLRRFLLILAAVTGIWTIVLAVTGGFVFELGSIPVFASRRPRNPGVIAVISALAAWALTPVAERRLLVSRLPPQTAPAIAAISAALVVAVALLRGAPYAGGSDAYGYVSQAEFWSQGMMRVQQPDLGDIHWSFAPKALTPIGYLPTADGRAFVPVFPPGYPLVMAAFQRLAGRPAVFYVVPLLGGLAVWMTYLMGTLLAGRAVGASAAVLLAASPPFLIQLMFTMSDVPVAAWWTVALTLLLFERRDAALLSGLAVGAAILTRPNLVPVAIVPGALLLWQTARERTLSGPAAQRTALFAAGGISGCVATAVINTHLYGSPLISGQLLVNIPFSWRYLLPNLARYPRWLIQTETPVVVLALAAPFVIARLGPERFPNRHPRAIAITWLCFIAAIVVSYVFYTPSDAWFWLRFLLPAFPPLLVLTSMVLFAIAERVDHEGHLLASILIAIVAGHGLLFGYDQEIFGTREGERRPLAIGDYIARRLPERAVFISMWHSGSIRYYSGRLTVRYDEIPPGELDAVIADLDRLHFHPYFVLEGWEESLFMNRFAGHSRLATLEWPAVALLDGRVKVRIYDPADQQTSLANRRTAVDSIP